MGTLLSCDRAASDAHGAESCVRVEVKSSSVVVYIYAEESISQVGEKRKRGGTRGVSIRVASGEPQIGANKEIAERALDTSRQASDADEQALDNSGEQTTYDATADVVGVAGGAAGDAPGPDGKL